MKRGKGELTNPRMWRRHGGSGWRGEGAAVPGRRQGDDEMMRSSRERVPR
jgi:hypothetical protein